MQKYIADLIEELEKKIQAEKSLKDLRDAAEFEARVAKLLSEPDTIEKLLVCWNWPEKKLPCEKDKDADCRRCRIKVARLLAEEEMDGHPFEK